ncbi:hypothetical protein Ami103574_08035 [Aminipila butyrica]|uniref:TadE-like protein n=1 Tax=Aminipila butyrica TaxID=433296 RepID=A0A858BX27_9FIRM|nr:hypothetical protein [Aminipila butyrica]QIB69274.1 hypothetical protein Ami103574_08035 [Aminipila butyrica]
MFNNTKKGNIGVETAILLPLVVLSILTIAYLIKVDCAGEAIISAAFDETRRLSIESYTGPGQLAAIGFPGRVEKRLRQETSCKGISVERFRYLYGNGYMDKLISFQVEYEMDPHFPISFYDVFQGKERILARAFVGSSRYGLPGEFSQMEQQEDSEIVWIFPVAGKKYHQENCSYIKVAATETILNSSIKKRFKPCSICEAAELEKGNVIYCFYNQGQSYHRPSCPSVERYVREIEKSQAIQRGYTPCLKCGGS